MSATASSIIAVATASATLNKGPKANEKNVYVYTLQFKRQWYYSKIGSAGNEVISKKGDE